jgi:hypothetical protein
MIIAKTDKDYDDDIENLAEKMLADFDIDIYDWIDNPIPDENISSESVH